jgi:hypothetical protein
MLAPEVQATAIEVRVRRGGVGVNGIQTTATGEQQVYAPSAFTSATEAGTARARAQSLSS